MHRLIPRAVTRLFIELWLNTSTRSWRRFPIPADSPTVHGAGSDPDRLLLTGSGVAAGHGVTTHELGLAGQLVRRLAVLTTRGADIDIVVRHDMTAVDCLDALAEVELSRFDAIIISVGVAEALALRSARVWRRDLEALLTTVRRECPASTQIFLLSLPLFSAETRFPRLFSRLITDAVPRYNAISAEICATLPNTTLVALDRAESVRSLGIQTHERRASLIAPWVLESLRSVGTTGRREAADESGRQRSLDDLGILDSAPEESLDLIASMARDLFDVPMAAITFIDEQRQWVKAAIGFVGRDIPRTEAFCNVTIAEARQLIVEDTRGDPRFSDKEIVTGPAAVRFYAGYPIESPDGHRLGALCVMDRQPRRFSEADASLLRELALRVQELVWSSAGRR
jgi:hypothetical protein